MKKSLLFSFSMLITIASFAQFPYTFSASTATYQSLTAGTSVNDTIMWDDDDYSIPMGFSFKFGDKSVDTFHLSSAAYLLADMQNVSNMFLITNLDLYDRGYAGDTVTRSPIRYEISGTAGSRIFKLEVANAGIFEEYDLYGTNNDSVYYQIWMYEGTNVVEVRFGPSHITKANYMDYYFMTGKPLHGYVSQFDNTTANFSNFYFLTGEPTTPKLDSVNNWLLISGGLNSHPSKNTVYKYTPKQKPTTSVENNMIANNINMINNISNSQLLINNGSAHNYSYKVISVNGSSMNVDGSLSNGKNIIDISNIPAGMYLLQVVGSNDAKTFKFNKI